MMQKLKIHGNIVTVPYSLDELVARLARSSAFLKACVGLGNNAAWSAALEAHDHIKTLPRYRQGVKRAFKDALAEFGRYEQRLLYDKEGSFFDVDSLSPEHRRKYGNISDREYYDFWAASGATAYARRRPFVTSMQNKYRLSLAAHGIPDAFAVGWALTAMAMLELADNIFRQTLNVCARDHGLDVKVLEASFGRFSLRSVADRWYRAMTLLEPLTMTYEISETEKRNIANGLDQLAEEFTSVATLGESLSETIESYGEIFRTAGEQDKALRGIKSI